VHKPGIYRPIRSDWGVVFIIWEESIISYPWEAKDDDLSAIFFGKCFAARISAKHLPLDSLVLTTFLINHQLNIHWVWI